MKLDEINKELLALDLKAKHHLRNAKDAGGISVPYSVHKGLVDDLSEICTQLNLLARRNKIKEGIKFKATIYSN